jgi:hypothetical protein
VNIVFRLLIVLGLVAVAASASVGCLADRLFNNLAPLPIPHQSPPKGLSSLSAKSCQPCHAEIYTEWSASQMGRAFLNPVFQADWQHQDQFYYCLSCHAPLEAQQPTRVTGLSGIDPPTEVSHANPLFDTTLQQEGVTCVACHLKDGALEGPHEVAAPHPTRFVVDFAGADRCERCHQIVPPPFPFSRSDRPLTDTHAEWKEWKKLTGRSETCTDCHMPQIERSSALGAPVRTGRKHTFPGGWDDDLVRAGVDMGEVRYVGGNIQVPLTNLSGHRFPTGEPARSLIVEATVYDGDGMELEQLETRIERRVKLPVGKELGDNTLAPSEVRIVSIPVSASHVHKVWRIRVELTFDRLANLPVDVNLQGANRRIKLASRETKAEHR